MKHTLHPQTGLILKLFRMKREFTDTMLLRKIKARGCNLTPDQLNAILEDISTPEDQEYEAILAALNVTSEDVQSEAQLLQAREDKKS